MDITEFFSSKLRMKILKVLVQFGELNVSEIARKLNINYDTAIRHLRILEDEGIVLHKTFGRIRLYRLNMHSPKAEAVQKLFKVWEHTNK
ncbi:MAG: winged helix-turn-helix domain-containing protein [Candidatus Bathyarchaeia archaeon]